MAVGMFWQEDRFYLALVADGLARDGSPDMFRTQRFYNLIQTFQSTFDLEGETAEAGCLFGLSSFLMCGYEKTRSAAFTGAGHHLFDSFVGLSFPDSQDVPQAKPNPLIGQLLERRKSTGDRWPTGRSFLERTKRVLADYPGGVYGCSTAGIPIRSHRRRSLYADQSVTRIFLSPNGAWRNDRDR
jgi:hypothetical protein